jgi:hypothetical protein
VLQAISDKQTVKIQPNIQKRHLVKIKILLRNDGTFG